MKYISVIQIVSAKMSNPNGDFSGGPRCDADGFGRITDVCIKSKIRKTVLDLIALGEVPTENNEIDMVAGIRGARGITGAEAIRRFWDIRTFGALLTNKQEKKSRKPKKNEDAVEEPENKEEGLDTYPINGPVQISYLQSIDPVEVIEDTITRKNEVTEGKGRAIGNKNVVQYGLYRGIANIQPCFAVKSGMTDADIQILFKAWKHMFDNDKAANRADVELVGLYVFEHEGPMMSAQNSAIDKALVIGKAPFVDRPKSLSDYHIKFDSAKIPKGVTLRTDLSIMFS